MITQFRVLRFTMVIVSIFLTATGVFAQRSEPLPFNIKGLNSKIFKETSPESLSTNLSNKAKYLRGATINTKSLSSGGSIQGGGGGDFSVSLFWQWVEEARLSISDDKAFSPLTPSQNAEVLMLMDPQVTKIYLTSESLHVTNKDGIKVKVDAVNVPEERIIYLNQPAWEKHFASGLEFRHLIVHEFLGLARINDDGYRISSRYFMSVVKPLPFGRNTVRCNGMGFMLYRDNPGFSIQSFYTLPSGSDIDLIVKFNTPERVGLVKNNKDESRLVKKANINAPLYVDKRMWRKTPALPEYSLNIDFIFGDRYYPYGMGAAAGHTFAENPDVQMISSLISKNPNSSEKTALAVQIDRVYSFDELNQLTLNSGLLNPAIVTLFLNAGVPLNPSNLGSGGVTVLQVQNISDLIWEYAYKRGAKNRNEAYKILNDTLFKDLPPTTPLYLNVSCTIEN